MEYRVEDVHYFFSTREMLHFFPLSNMAAGMPIIWKGSRYNSTEALYQASKYGPDVICLPFEHKRGTDPNVRRRILTSGNAMGAKMTQKCAVKAGLVRPDWNDISIHAMQWVLELKLQQHPDTFGRTLQATGTYPIVEKSSKDSFWGCIQGADGIFRGENVLGKLLVNLRGRYDWVVAGNLTSPEGFLIP